MKRIVAFLVFIQIFTQSFSQVDSAMEAKYYEMYKTAENKTIKGDTIFQVRRTAPFYVVVFVTDLKSGITKELAVEYPYLEGAIRKDSNKSVIILKDRVFKFYSDEALKNVGFYSFDDKEKSECLENITAELLISKWKEDSIKFQNTYKGECQKYYAFLLFKEGVMSRRGSLVSSLLLDIGEE